MKARRVVLGVNEGGKAVVLSDADSVRNAVMRSAPGFEVQLLWSTDAVAAVGGGGHSFRDPAITANFLPGPGESRLLLVTFPPDAVMTSADFDGAAFGEEFSRLLPGLAETFEADAPGMHTTDSIDYDVVLDGELWLELDDGQEVLLRRNDVVVQQGNRHAWRNKTDRPATIMAVLMGKRRA